MARAALVNLGDGFAARAIPGEGSVVFWIHGYTLDSTWWVSLWDSLPGWRHVGIDLPGHGTSLPLHADNDYPVSHRK